MEVFKGINHYTFLVNISQCYTALYYLEKPLCKPLHLCPEQTQTNGQIRNSTTRKQCATGDNQRNVFGYRVLFERPAQRF